MKAGLHQAQQDISILAMCGLLYYHIFLRDNKRELLM